MIDRTRGNVIVVGAGAAGLTAAIFAATACADVLLLDSTTDGGRKILISGGGRCNILPSEIDSSLYVTASSPNSLRKILSSWPLREQRAFFEENLSIPLALEAETGKLFPVSNRARDVRDGLIRKAREAGVTVAFGQPVTGVAPRPGGGWVAIRGDRRDEADCLVLATGGLSVPKTGSDGRGLAIAEKLGHTVHSLYPALTPLTAEPPVHAGLAGISLKVSLTAPVGSGRFSTSGGFLFTHHGYSGPAILDISHLATRAADPADQPIFVQWSELDEAAWSAQLTAGGPGTINSVLRQHLPTRLADRLIEESGLDGARTLARLRRDERTAITRMLTHYALPWSGDEGYRKAEVTGGGVSLAEVHPATLESRIASGLFLCGELLDAFGPIGGYNFAWAWATGRAAGVGAAASACGH